MFVSPAAQGADVLERKSPTREPKPEIEPAKVISFLPRRSLRKTALSIVYTLRVYLIRGPYGEDAVGQEIYRTIQVRGDQSLEDLHYAIFCSFDRELDQSYEYCFGKDPYDRNGARYVCWDTRPGSEVSRKRKVKTAKRCSLDSLTLQEDQLFSYWFGIGEEWMHLVHVLSIEPVEPHEEYPLLIEKVGCPPVADPSAGVKTEGEAKDQRLAQEVLRLLVGEFQMRWRQNVENSPLSRNPRLLSALRRLPAPWLEGVCLKVKLKGSGKRTERIQQLLEHLSVEENLREIWRSLPLPSREMLAWILTEQGGWATILRLSRRYGTDRDISWWWNEGQEPVTPLGMLRFHGLVYVGRTRIGERKYRIAAVPVELRKYLQKIVREPDSMAGSPPLSAGTPDKEGSRTRAESRPSKIVRALPDLWQGLDSLSLRSFLTVCPLRKDTEGLYTRMLGRIRRDSGAFPRSHLQEFLDRMVRGGSRWSRLAAYKFGMSLFGRHFASSACRDESSLIRQWARSLLDERQEELF